jgi:hypothetical protein
MSQMPLADVSWERMIRAVEKVRERLQRAAAALSQAGFIRRHVAGIEMFLDGPRAKAREAVHIVLAGEKVRPQYVEPAPDVSEAEDAPLFRILRIEALVRMKLTSFQDKDRMHLRDLLDVGLIDGTWRDKLPPALAARLQELLDNPEG